MPTADRGCPADELGVSRTKKYSTARGQAAASARNRLRKPGVEVRISRVGVRRSAAANSGSGGTSRARAGVASASAIAAQRWC